MMRLNLIRGVDREWLSSGLPVFSGMFGQVAHYLLSDIESHRPKPFTSSRFVTNPAFPASTLIPSVEGFSRLSPRLSERIIARLFEAEGKEHNAHLRDDYRIASKTVYNCAHGIRDPWRYAFWTTFGKIPEKLIPLFAEQADRNRKAIAANAALLEALTRGSPKKPVQSVREVPRERKRNA
jgi:hypothetical protein